MSTIHVRSFDHPVCHTQLRVVSIRHDNPAPGPTLVFLHDALGSIRQWRDFPEWVAKSTGLHVLVYEREGHGYSAPLLDPRTPDYQHQEAQLILPALLHDLGIKQPLLIGHSDGGTIALLYAATANPAGVIALAPHVIVEEITRHGIRATLQTQKELLQKLAFYHGHKAEQLLHAWADTWLSPQFADWNILQELSQISCPVWVLQGAQDEFGSRLQLDLIQQHVQGPTRCSLLDATGHIPHLEQPLAVLDFITQFINQALNPPNHANQDKLPFRNQ